MHHHSWVKLKEVAMMAGHSSVRQKCLYDFVPKFSSLLQLVLTTWDGIVSAFGAVKDDDTNRYACEPPACGWLCACKNKFLHIRRMNGDPVKKLYEASNWNARLVRPNHAVQHSLANGSQIILVRNVYSSHTSDGARSWQLHRAHQLLSTGYCAKPTNPL